jgi:hypothetical protein
VKTKYSEKTCPSAASSTTNPTCYLDANPDRIVVRRHSDALRKSVTIYTNSVRTSQETQHVSATKPNRLILFRKIIAVCCENHMKHKDELCGLNVEFNMVKQVVNMVITGL